MMTIGKEFTFCAAHKLPLHAGKCHNLHGHEWTLRIEVSGGFNPASKQEETGMLMDFSRLKSIVQEKIIDRYDHAFLNEYFENPTAETMVLSIMADLRDCFRPLILKSVRLYETPGNYAEWRNDA